MEFPQSYKGTVLHCAKTITEGIRGLGESVANSITGKSNFKPSVACPGSPQSGFPSDNGKEDKGHITIVNLEVT